MAWEDRAYHREGFPSFGGGGSGSGPKFVFPMPSKLTFGIIVANVLMFVLKAFPSVFAPVAEFGMLTFIDHLGFIEPWRFITYQYIHGSAWHLFGNLIGIYFFLPVIEHAWGWKRAFAFYTAGGIVAGLAYAIISIFYPGVLIGASGSILAVLGACTAIMPDMQVLALIIPMTMRTLALLCTVFYVLSIIGDRDPADAAHLGGLAFGFLSVRFGRGVWTDLSRNLTRSRIRRLEQTDRDEQENVDRILHKVSTQGMSSLSRAERKTLKRATEHQRQRDLELTELRRR
jgi:rhomboid family protein